MKKIANSIIKYRFIITPILLLITVYTFTLADDVNINYDFSKYLPEESIATQDTNSVRDSIDFPISITLMVDDLTTSEVEKVKGQIEDLENIEFVLIDTEDNGNYKDNHALYTIFLQSDTEDIGSVIESIESELSAYDIYLSGNYANTYHQEQKVEEETGIILIVACAVIFAILLLTTRRYLEPIAFGLVIGIAIVINLGTNIIFPEISYITKSVAAVLQLGLSMDYSIILLNNYYHEKAFEVDNKDAMIKALTKSLKPISASSLTTIIGLLALLFMSFTIGTDIGLVLSKGIVISLICVFLLLPNMILWLEKVPFNKEHKTINISRLAVKSSNKKVAGSITGFAFIFIIGMFYVQGLNTFTFTDDTKFEDEEAIKAVFGDSNTFVIGITNNDDLYDNELAMMNKINEKYSDQIISYLGEVNSSKKHITYQDLTGLTDEDNAKLLMSLYALDNGKTNEMSYYRYTEELETLINNETVIPTEEMSDLTKVITIKNLLDTTVTSEELLSSGLLPEDTDHDMINIIFKSYEFDTSQTMNKNVTLRQYLTGLSALATANESLVSNSEELDSLNLLNTQLTNINNLLNNEATPLEFQAIMAAQFGATLDEATINAIYQNYYLMNGLSDQTTIPVRNTLQFMLDNSMFTETQATTITGLLTGDALANNPVPYTEIETTLNNTIYSLTGEIGTTSIDSTLSKITYITILDSVGMIPNVEIEFNTLIAYINTLTTDDTLSSLLTVETKSSLSILNAQISLLTNEIVYSEEDITALLSSEANEDLNTLTSVIYASNYSKKDEINTYSVSVESLLTYITENNPGLSVKEMQEIESLQAELTTMKNIISSEQMSLIVLNTTLPYESEETTKFINYIYDDVYDTVDEDTYFIGYSVSDAEIKTYFEDDLLKINFITIGSVLLILIISFQSVIIPVLLVFTIEGAIWTTLSYSYVLGEDIFFFCYIVIGAIQLGATIDYAIILTTNYQRSRKETNKAEALRDALKKSIPSILTSGTILTIAGFAIAFVSSQSSIVSVGSLLGRGTLISMIFVVTVLPSMLYTFDTLIIKSQKNAQKKKQKLRKKFTSFL